MRSWIKRYRVALLLGMVLILAGIVLFNWDNISSTRTVQTKLKILESLQSNEPDSARMILQDYLDSL